MTRLPKPWRREMTRAQILITLAILSLSFAPVTLMTVLAW